MARYRRNDFLIPTLGVLFDGIAIEFAFLLSYALRFKFSLFNLIPLEQDKPPLDAYLYGSLVIIPVWLLIFNSRNCTARAGISNRRMNFLRSCVL